jgi:hypothetical protein
MMATTHALAGFVLGAVVAAFAPAYAPLAIPAAVAGSVVPDLDLYRGHRRTLHYPTLYPLGAALAGGLSLLAPTPGTVAAALFLLGAALHTTLDLFGGGLELRPWEATSERAVYDHVREQWLAPRRWVRYDGAPEDLLFAGALTALAYPFHGALARTAMLALLTVSATYVALRRPLAALAPVVVGRLPPEAREYVPRRYVEG